MPSFVQYSQDQMTLTVVGQGIATASEPSVDAKGKLISTRNREGLRFLSVAGSPKVVRALDRALRRPTTQRFHWITWRDDQTHIYLHVCVSQPFTTTTKMLDAQVMQLVAWPASAAEGAVVIDPDQDWAAAVRTALLRSTDLPLLPEWAPDIAQAFEQHGWFRHWKLQGSVPTGADVRTTPENMAALLEHLMKSGALVLPEGPSARDTAIGTVGRLDSYLKTFGPALGRSLAHQARHQPGNAQPYPLRRTLFGAQADTADAVRATWAAGERHVWLVGEQGVGKTLIGLAAAWKTLEGQPGRILVHAPGHLTAKWAREARETLPANTRIRVVRSWKEAYAALSSLRQPPAGLEVWILPRDTAKLSWNWRSAAIPTGQEEAPWKCPDCGADLVRTFQDPKKQPEPWPAETFAHRGKNNRVCPACQAALWQADRTGPRRIAPATLWARRLPRNTFDVLLADEAHEEKGDTAQGAALGRLLRISRRSALLTGTLLGGKASDLMHLIGRTQPQRFREAGYDPGGSSSGFLATYGRSEKREFVRDHRKITQTRELPGVHPALYSDWLMGQAVFLELQDLQVALPDYEEVVTLVPMAPAQAARVQPVMQALKSAAGAAFHQGKRGPLGSYVQAAMAYPDRVWHPDTPRLGSRAIPVSAPAWDPDKVLPKEAALVATALREQAAGRRCAVFCTFTGVYDVTERLRRLFTEQGLTVAHLTKAVPPAEREAWIRAHPADILLCHPKLVSTGLDLFEYPTVLWAQTDWSLYLLRQASRRSWRIGQDKPVRVHFFAYADTMQATALQVLAEKMLAAQAIEGRFSAEGLQALAEGADTALRLAEALAYGLEATADLETVWSVTPAVATTLTPKPAPNRPPLVAPASSGPIQTVRWADLRPTSRRHAPEQLVLTDLWTPA